VDKFATEDKLIDKSLCDSRNSIAHDRDHYPEPGTFDALHLEVMEMMEDLRDIIIDQRPCRL
jgi:hypothetical protein